LLGGVTDRADDMGLGKTIQTISLLLDAKAKAKERVKAAAVANDASSAASTTASSAASTTASSAASASSVDAAVGGSTLVVAPTSALIQWSEEIVKFAGDELSVLIYYDKRAGMTIDELKSHDVVLTTYQIAEHEWRSEDNLTKLPCIHCEK
jgi:DNA repair protein RAD16